MTKQKMFLRMITASLVRRRSRMLVALLAIAVGGTILSGLVTIYYDVPRQMGAQFRNYGANMIFVAADSDSSLTMTAADEAASVIPDDKLVGMTPYRYETIRIHEQPIVAAGTDIDSAKTTSPYWHIDGEWPGAGEVLMGGDVAELLGLGAGDAFNATYSSGDDDSEEVNLGVDMKVSGILETGGSEENYIYMSMDDLNALAGEDERLDVVELSISAAQDELTSYADAVSGASGTVMARLVKRVTQSESTVLTKLQALVFLVTAVVLVLTMICVATTMTAVVAERRREIGLRKALGASDRSIIGEFMGEGLLLGGVGGLIGSVLGFAFAQLVSVNVFSSSITFQPLLIPVTMIVSIVVTGLACLMPVRTTMAIDPALVLKGE